MLLTVVPVESKKAQCIQEGKLVGYLRVIQDKNYTKEDIRVREIDTYDFRILKIATHNINSLKTNKFKLDSLIGFAVEEKIDIIRINETNIIEQHGKFLVKKRVIT